MWIEAQRMAKKEGKQIVDFQEYSQNFLIHEKERRAIARTWQVEFNRSDDS
jgi:hypothetical protein